MLQWEYVYLRGDNMMLKLFFECFCNFTLLGYLVIRYFIRLKRKYAYYKYTSFFGHGRCKHDAH
jgi:hypothetical protein